MGGLLSTSHDGRGFHGSPEGAMTGAVRNEQRVGHQPLRKPCWGKGRGESQGKTGVNSLLNFGDHPGCHIAS